VTADIESLLAEMEDTAPGYESERVRVLLARVRRLEQTVAEQHQQLAAAVQRSEEADLQLRDMRRLQELSVQNQEALRVARDESERASQAKSRFLATASHDLRQPVQALSMLNGMLRRRPLSEDVAEAVLAQEQALTGMARLLNALLDISKLESGAIKPMIEDFELQVILGPIQTEFAELARDKGLRLEVVSVTCTARSDPTLLGQILRNLMSNAIRYTAEGNVCLRCIEESGKIRVDVEDSGIGIAESHLPYIFDEFYQVKEARGTREGHGLGLNIVRRVAKLLDHEVSVRSTVGRGTTFSVSVPAAAA
jgi:two-component system, sensor histidine kinase